MSLPAGQMACIPSVDGSYEISEKCRISLLPACGCMTLRGAGATGRPRLDSARQVGTFSAGLTPNLAAWVELKRASDARPELTVGVY